METGITPLGSSVRYECQFVPCGGTIGLSPSLYLQSRHVTKTDHIATSKDNKSGFTFQ
jgi:hypothetical protein